MAIIQTDIYQAHWKDYIGNRERTKNWKLSLPFLVCLRILCARVEYFFFFFLLIQFSDCVRFHWRLNVFSKSQTPISIALLLWRAFKSVRSHMRKQQKYFVKYRWIIEWRAKSDSLSTWLECDTKRKCTALNLSSACLLWMLGLNSQHKVTSKTGIRKIAK